jgi:hypothetical protein
MWDNSWITVNINNFSGRTWKNDEDVYRYLLSSKDICRQLIREGRFDRKNENHPFFIHHRFLPVPILMKYNDDDEDLRAMVENRLRYLLIYQEFERRYK